MSAVGRAAGVTLLLGALAVMGGAQEVRDEGTQVPTRKDRIELEPPKDILIEMDPKGDGYSQILLDDGKKKLTYSFGPLGRQVVDLHRRMGQNAPMGEVAERVDRIYADQSISGEFGGKSRPGTKASPENRDIPESESRALGVQAYPELLKARQVLRRGDFQKARGHLVLVEASMPAMSEDVRGAYADELGAVKAAYSLPATKDSLRRLAAAAQRRDADRKKAAEEQLAYWGRSLVDLKTGKPVDPARLEAISREITAAYSPKVQAPARPSATGGWLSESFSAARKAVFGKGPEPGTAREPEKEEGFWEWLKRKIAELLK